MKRMLRDKANFGVLEGLITVLLNEPVHIVELLESEGNQDAADDKFNRVDIKAKNDRGELFLVEVQLTREVHYLERILYGTAKAITEHIRLGESYGEVKKVYSINIVYFDLGEGADYLYHGRNIFKGVHTGDTLKISTKENGVIRMRAPEDVFPEYFIIRVNEFNEIAHTPLEEWLDYLKNGHIKDDTQAPGLQEAREKLQYLMLNKADRHAYDEHLNAVMIQNDVLGGAFEDGVMEGMKRSEKALAEERQRSKNAMAKERLRSEKALAEERQRSKKAMQEEKLFIARSLKQMGMADADVAKATGLSQEDIANL